MSQPALIEQPAPHLKLDLGCGPNKVGPEWTGVDVLSFDGKVDLVHDLRTAWPWESDSVEEVFSSHFLEHLTGEERVHFFNELHRVLKPGRSARIITPHWNSTRAFGDPTHKWPPVSEFAYFYLNKAWRDTNAPHTGYVCDFAFPPVVAWNLRPDLNVRNDAYKQFALENFKDSAADLICTITKM